MPDLTTLKAVKAWLNISGDTDDQLMCGLIGQVSGMILSYIGRSDIFRRQYTDQFTGVGGPTRMLRNFPAIGVISVNVGRLPISPSNDGIGHGYWLDIDDGVPPGRLQTLHLNSYRFDRVPCKVVYEAGYFISDEPQSAAASVSVLAEYGNWARDEGVSYANGTALIKVAGSPAQGQYALNSKMPGAYIFNAADYGQAVLIDYSYVPAVLEQACIEIIGERLRYKERIGQASKNISGEVISFSLKDMQDYVKLMLQPYRRLVPV